jgi:hypothetical protein
LCRVIIAHISVDMFNLCTTFLHFCKSAGLLILNLKTTYVYLFCTYKQPISADSHSKWAPPTWRLAAGLPALQSAAQVMQRFPAQFMQRFPALGGSRL